MRAMGDAKDIQGPLILHSETVRSDWIDYNGHMNVAYYVLAFDHATDAFLDFLGLDANYRKTRNATTFAAEAHVTYLRELHEGDPMRFTTQLLGHDNKRLHYFHHMYHGTEGFLAATFETLSLHIDLAVRKTSPLPAEVNKRVEAIWREHAHFPKPEQAGRVIAVRKKSG